MAVEVQPPELAELLDLAERPRTANWSLRAALTRYAQPQPRRASDVIELLRRAEAALKGERKRLEKDGPAVWALVCADADADADAAGDDRALVELLRSLRTLDGLADTLAGWAVDREGERPDAAVDAVVADVTRRFDDLGVAREERAGPPSGGGGRRRPAKPTSTDDET